MPHIESHLLKQHMCFRLADSLPTEVVEAMWEELKATPPSLRSPEMERRVMTYLDGAMASVFCVSRNWRSCCRTRSSVFMESGIRCMLGA